LLFARQLRGSAIIPFVSIDTAGFQSIAEFWLYGGVSFDLSGRDRIWGSCTGGERFVELSLAEELRGDLAEPSAGSRRGGAVGESLASDRLGELSLLSLRSMLLS
jgi:hypothetical protein